MWYLHIREVQEADRGFYMCQINTDPMKSQVGYLDVVGKKSHLYYLIEIIQTSNDYKLCNILISFSVPPDILDYPTSTDMVVQENSNVSLTCAASGSPTPRITWRKEGGELIALNGQEGNELCILNYTRVRVIMSLSS